MFDLKNPFNTKNRSKRRVVGPEERKKHAEWLAAAQEGDLEKVKSVLESGFSLNGRILPGMTFLSIAAEVT